MLPKSAAFGLLSLSVSTAFVVACGDGEPAKSTSSSAGVGGESTTGGASPKGGATQTGGSSAKGGSGGLAGASTTNIGGSSTAGTSNSGGTTAAGASNGGTSAAGTSNGGSSAIGGTSTLGGTASGGTSGGGGTTNIGGTSTAGTSTSGATSSTGGSSSATGGTLGTGGSSALTCTASFVLPAKAALTNSDDLNSNCSDGIQADVQVATSAPAGTQAILSLTSGTTTTELSRVNTSGLLVTFPSANLGSSGQETLTVSIGGTACQTQKVINVNCAGAPACTIASPLINSTHPALNGVPAPSGDRVSSAGATYQAAFQVTTDIQDGQPVVLTVDGVNYQTAAASGAASFPGVYFANTNGSPDGQHTVSAQCTARSGQVGSTGNLSYPVDTTPPVLTPEKGTGSNGNTISALANGDHFGPADDADADPSNGLQIKLCGSTTSSDAVDIAAPNPNVANFCAAVGGNSPQCASVVSTANNTACVVFNCPGSGPFDVDLTLKDKASNPTTVKRTNLTCATASPSVTFLAPVSDSPPFSDLTKRILSATNVTATLRDANPSKAGAQFDVLACTNASIGSTAILSTGFMGQTLTQNATTTVVADTNSQCSGGNLVAFSGATLPESQMDSAFNLTAATELSIAVTDLNLAVGTAVSDVWVDSNDPTLTLTSPTGFCGSYFNTSGTGSANASVNLTFASAVPVTVTVQSQAGQANFAGATPASNQVLVSSVQLLPGSDTVSAVATKPSTNSTQFGGCDVTVGNTPPPTVSWQTPTSANLLTASGNPNTNAIADSSTNPGWQGTLKVCTNLDATANPGATVQFTQTIAGTTTTIGTANIVADSSCTSGFSATLSGTVSEGASVLLTATTTPLAGNPGVASITLPVDVSPPAAPSGLGAVVKNRRQTSFTLSWVAPSDSPSGNAAGYKIRWAKSAITSLAAFNAATDVPFAGTPAPAGSQDSIDISNLLIENNYYFAVAAVDSVGNLGQFVYTTAAARASFIQVDLKPILANQMFGDTIDASGDFNGDGFSDLLISYGSGPEVDVYFGSLSGVTSTPSVRIQSASSPPVSPFGYSVAAIGDINADGFEDLAIGSATDGNGTVYVYYGRSSADWGAKASWTQADANVKIGADATAFLGAGLARLGDFNGDGIDDFAIGAPRYNSSAGLVEVILGVAQSGGGLPATISLPSDVNHNAIRFNGDSSSLTFGYRVLGLGAFYGASTLPAMVVAAPYANGGTGILYAFTGGASGPIAVSGSTNSLTGGPNDFLGFQNLNLLGNIGPGGQPALGVSLSNATPVRVDAWSGITTNGPFGAKASFISSETTTNAFGRVFVGGGSSGRSAVFSFIGSSRADVAVSTSANNNARLYIVDGDKITMTASASPAAIETQADVTVSLIGSFLAFTHSVNSVPDLDGDSYGDLVVAEGSATTTSVSGHVVVLR